MRFPGVSGAPPPVVSWHHSKSAGRFFASQAATNLELIQSAFSSRAVNRSPTPDFVNAKPQSFQGARKKQPFAAWHLSVFALKIRVHPWLKFPVVRVFHANGFCAFCAFLWPSAFLRALGVLAVKNLYFICVSSMAKYPRARHPQNHARRRLSRPQRPSPRNRPRPANRQGTNCSSRSPSAASAPPTSKKSSMAPFRPRASSATKPPAPSSRSEVGSQKSEVGNRIPHFALRTPNSKSATASPCTITSPAWTAISAGTMPLPNARPTSAPASPPGSSRRAAATPNTSASCPSSCPAS
jgi:hypothetical protein